MWLLGLIGWMDGHCIDVRVTLSNGFISQCLELFLEVFPFYVPRLILVLGSLSSTSSPPSSLVLLLLFFLDLDGASIISLLVSILPRL